MSYPRASQSASVWQICPPQIPPWQVPRNSHSAFVEQLMLGSPRQLTPLQFLANTHSPSPSHAIRSTPVPAHTQYPLVASYSWQSDLPPQVVELQALGKKIGAASAYLQLSLVVILYLMIWKPGY